MALNSMTVRQAECLEYLKDRIAETGGIAPSYEEIRQHLGLASKSGVARLIGALEERGHIQRIPNRARCIAIRDDEGLAAYSTQSLVAELARRREINVEARSWA